MKKNVLILWIILIVMTAWCPAQIASTAPRIASGLSLQKVPEAMTVFEGFGGHFVGQVAPIGSPMTFSERDDQDDPAYALYKEGYKLVLSEQWANARKRFEQLLEKYPKSKYVADASYWMAYALKYIDKKKALAAYEEFIKTYRGSKYYDDAISDLGRLGGKTPSPFSRYSGGYAVGVPFAVTSPAPVLAPDNVSAASAFAEQQIRGSLGSQYQEAVGTPEVRMKVEAFMALVHSGRDEKTFEMVKEVLLDPKQPIQLREAALSGLRQVEEQARSWNETANSKDQSRNMKEAAKDALQKLESKDVPGIYLQVLKSDTSKRLSRTILYQLGFYAERGDDRALKALQETALDVGQDRQLREAALYGLRQVKKANMVEFFAQIAKSEKDKRMRMTALYAMAQSDNADEEKAYKLLSEYALDKNESREMREAALSSIRSLRGKNPASLYLEVAKNDPDERIQQMALYHFVEASKKEPEMAFGVLKEIVSDRKRTWSMRESAMSLLPRFDNDEALNLLVTIAKNDPEERLRMSAINHISQIGRNKSSSLKTLIGLYDTYAKDQSNLVQSLMYSIASIGNDEAVGFLGRVAKTSENIEVRRSAIQLLGNIGGEKAREILLEILKGK